MPQFVTYADKVFTCSGKLTIYKVAECRRLLNEFYSSEADKKGQFFLDLSALESVDASMFQLFVSLKKTIEKNNGKLVLKNSCQPFDAMLDILGIPADTFLRAA